MRVKRSPKNILMVLILSNLGEIILFAEIIIKVNLDTIFFKSLLRKLAGGISKFSVVVEL